MNKMSDCRLYTN